MTAHCLRHSEVPHTSKLFRDLLYDFNRVSAWYAYAPNALSSFSQAAREIQFPPERRAALVAALREQNGESPSLALLARPETIAIVTGQQVGLFGGACYSVYKALTAVRIASELTAQGTPAVPIFWLATEDHDFAEVDHAWLFSHRYQPVRLQVHDGAGQPQPVGQVRLEQFPLQELREALGGFPYADEILPLVEESYGGHDHLGTAFQSLFQKLLGRFDLLYLDPLQPAIRELAAPVLRQAVEAAPDLAPALLQRNADLEAAGYHAQVHLEPQTSLFFLLDGGRRIALRRQGAEYIAKDKRYSAAELAGRASQLSPNALLRPVVQDSILPTAAYVGGPAELAYMAQSEVLYRRLLGRMPVITPRSGFTLIDDRTAKLLHKHRLAVPDLFVPTATAQERIARALVPASVQESFQDTQRTIENALHRLRGELDRFDPTLALALDNSQGKMLYQLAKTQRKIASESMRRDQRAAADAAYLTTMLYPEKTLQERLYGILPFLARHGLGLLDHVYAHLHLECPDHVLLRV